MCRATSRPAICRESGFTVIEATTGAEALRIMEESRPPIVLLDVQLPDIMGFDVCAFIKEKWPQTMVLMTSSTFITSASRTRGLDSGADMFLVQPAEPLELAAGIHALLRIRRSEDALRALNASLEQRVQDRVSDLSETNARLTQEISQRQKAEVGAGAGAEDGGGRSTDRRARPRFQQSADGRGRQSRSDQGARQRSQDRAACGKCLQGGRARLEADGAIAGLLAHSEACDRAGRCQSV